jgi:predicted metal-binding membrane protein
MSAQGEMSRPGLIRALARPRAIALLCIATLMAAGWGYLGLALAGEFGSTLFETLCRPVLRLASAFGPLAVLLTFVMWCAMVLAMMLPTAAPMITTYATLTETAATKGESAVSPLVLTAGYIAVWIGVAAALTALQILLARAAILDYAMRIDHPYGSGALFLVAGAYQFTALKRACLTHCQHPFRFFFANWTAEPRAVFRLGVQQGLYCLGCCWAMMLLMFAVGVMNVVWMAILGAIMATEKLAASMRFSQLTGVGFVAIGLIIIVETWILGWPQPG